MRTALASLALASILVGLSAGAADNFDLKNAFWHIRLEELFKPQKKDPAKEDTKKKKKKKKKPGDKNYRFSGGNGRLTDAELEAGGHRFEILMLHKGDAPKPEIKGDSVVVGKQKISFDGKTLTLAKF